MTERVPMMGKSFLNHFKIGGFNLGEVLDPNNNLDKLGNAVQSGDIGGIFDTVGDMLEDLEDRYDQASDLLEELITAGKGGHEDLADVRARRTRMRQTRRKMVGLQKRIANERRIEGIEQRVAAQERARRRTPTEPCPSTPRKSLSAAPGCQSPCQRSRRPAMRSRPPSWP